MAGPRGLGRSGHSGVRHESSPSAALLRGLRRPGDEPQLTQAIAAVAGADYPFAAGFLRLVLRETGVTVDVPADVTVSAEEVVPDGRVDLRFRAQGLDVIVELKIHAGYGPKWLDRYLAALTDVEHAFVVAVTRDDPTYGEPRERRLARRDALEAPASWSAGADARRPGLDTSVASVPRCPRNGGIHGLHAS